MRRTFKLKNRVVRFVVIALCGFSVLSSIFIIDYSIDEMTEQGDRTSADQQKYLVNKRSQKAPLDTSINNVVNQPQEPKVKPIPRQLNPTDAVPVKSTANPDEPRNIANRMHYSYDDIEFKTLVRSRCPKGEMWPFITLPKQCAERRKNSSTLCFSTSSLPRTALASFPGCGNTWLRHLIQQLTGVWTGSMYRDRQLLDGGFLGEGRRNGSVIAIKTHYPYIVHQSPDNIESFQRTVLLIRSFQDCMLSDFQRYATGKHSVQAPPGSFNGTFWKHIHHHAVLWYRFYKHWIENKTCTLVVDYNRLKTDLADELRQLALFLGVRGDRVEDGIFRALKNSVGRFKRSHKPSLSVYTDDQRETIEHYNGVMAKLLEKRINYKPKFTWS